MTVGKHTFQVGLDLTVACRHIEELRCGAIIGTSFAHALPLIASKRLEQVATARGPGDPKFQVSLAHTGLIRLRHTVSQTLEQG